MPRLLIPTFALLALACGGPSPAVDASKLVDGCEPLESPVASAGAPLGGDSYKTLALPFFQAWCLRCHSTKLAADRRSGAPAGLDWDDEAKARAHLDAIREAVGVTMAMPPDGAQPTCDERRRLVRWMDAGAP